MDKNLAKTNLPAVVAPVVFAVHEGGVWRLKADKSAPIRVYASGVIEDEIWQEFAKAKTSEREKVTWVELLLIIAGAYKLQNEWADRDLYRLCEHSRYHKYYFDCDTADKLRFENWVPA